ncbi:unnamed protein product [Thelazia callipaeda]|uniref:tRNA (Cytosine(38)-C(5))-methyltransferase n=1 Tax=Thelazia callipaeda TaxID=103827 RepID=A0A0N5D5H0_THECL|nr:unnamed protein product [Thelazia callipaeda]
MVADSNEVGPVKCLEFFAGIGGFHHALQEAGVKAVIRALDINNVTNTIYKYNFPHTEIQQCNIEKLKSDYYDDYNADLWLMSPPCQPFTRKGLKKDMKDYRCNALKNICIALKTMKCIPRYIILENVCGFETSEIHDMLKNTLLDLSYYIEEYILSPTEIGIPNSRPRYYLLANLSTRNAFNKSFIRIANTWPIVNTRTFCKKFIGQYLCSEADEDDTLLILLETIQRFIRVIHFVTPSSSYSCCFTKSYYHYFAGTGSVLFRVGKQIQDEEMSMEQLRKMALGDKFMDSQIRYLSWREVANLLGFPATFMKPPEISVKQMYRSLGNSITVSGVSLLIQHLLKL